ncbi:MAG TPA: acyl-CoA dehydrogenase family protein [Acidimicrobiia bacterium]|nr:acyl-CoA dehydrogenase family protein [Acidimicrobiia bacterium]
MELEFTTEQDELRESIRTVLANECPLTLAREVTENGTGAERLWSTLRALGWAGLTIPSEHGGVGLGAVEAAILAEELGRAVAPGPLLPTVTQLVPAISHLGAPEQHATWLPAIAAGECTGALAIVDEHDTSPDDAPATTVRRNGERAVVRGRKRYVLEGDAVDELVVLAHDVDTDRLTAVLVPRAAATTTRVQSLDRSRRFAHATFDDVEVDRARVLDGTHASGGDAIGRVVDEATLPIALEMVGTAQRAFDMTLEYARNREQFGVPIGSFQAVKHKLADMFVALERARATGYFAAATLAEDDPRRAGAVAVAKIAAGDCQRLIAKETIQLHGGIGYTWEHDAHLLVKRLKSGEPLFGTSAHHRARLAELLGV